MRIPLAHTYANSITLNRRTFNFPPSNVFKLHVIKLLDMHKIALQTNPMTIRKVF